MKVQEKESILNIKTATQLIQPNYLSFLNDYKTKKNNEENKFKNRVISFEKSLEPNEVSNDCDVELKINDSLEKLKPNEILNTNIRFDHGEPNPNTQYNSALYPYTDKIVESRIKDKIKKPNESNTNVEIEHIGNYKNQKLKNSVEGNKNYDISKAKVELKAKHDLKNSIDVKEKRKNMSANLRQIKTFNTIGALTSNKSNKSGVEQMKPNLNIESRVNYVKKVQNVQQTIKETRNKTINDETEEKCNETNIQDEDSKNNILEKRYDILNRKDDIEDQFNTKLPTSANQSKYHNHPEWFPNKYIYKALPVPKHIHVKTDEILNHFKKKRNISKTSTEPFSFDKRDQTFLNNKNKKIEEIHEEERKRHEFHAKPLPIWMGIRSFEKTTKCSSIESNNKIKVRPQMNVDTITKKNILRNKDSVGEQTDIHKSKLKSCIKSNTDFMHKLILKRISIKNSNTMKMKPKDMNYKIINENINPINNNHPTKQNKITFKDINKVPNDVSNVYTDKIKRGNGISKNKNHVENRKSNSQINTDKSKKNKVIEWNKNKEQNIRNGPKNVGHKRNSSSKKKIKSKINDTLKNNKQNLMVQIEETLKPNETLKPDIRDRFKPSVERFNVPKDIIRLIGPDIISNFIKPISTKKIEEQKDFEENFSIIENSKSMIIAPTPSFASSTDFENSMNEVNLHDLYKGDYYLERSFYENS